MAIKRSRLTVAGALLLGGIVLGGCASQPDPVSSTLAGEPSRSGGQAATPGDTGGLMLNTTSFQPVEVTLGPPTGTEVGRRIEALRQDLVQLQNSIGANNGQLQAIRESAIAAAQQYNGLVAAIRARLQVGTTPGNPILVSQLSEAQLALEDIAAQVDRMTQLSGQAASDSSLSAFLMDSINATFDLSGAVDEDHRQLTILQDETRRTAVLIDRILLEVAEDIGRQNAYVGNERRDLQTLQLAVANGEFYGANLSGVSSAAASEGLRVQPASATASRPLVVIRFHQGDVDYQQPVYNAVSAALESRPNATFDIVAISPSSGESANVALSANAARERAADVKRTLVAMGLPARRMNVSASADAGVAGSEVHIFVN